jgi:hypothetical protein
VTRHKSHRFDEYSPDSYRELYAHDWGVYVQQERDDATVAMGKRFEGVHSIADLSAGGAKITALLADYFGVAAPVLGDFWDGYGYPLSGPIIETVRRIDPVDLFVCTETIEHLYDPDEALRLVREKTRFLLLTTPILEEPHLVSHGHLWTWRQEDVEEMLGAAEFSVIEFEAVSIFGLWRLR